MTEHKTEWRDSKLCSACGLPFRDHCSVCPHCGHRAYRQCAIRVITRTIPGKRWWNSDSSTCHIETAEGNTIQVTSNFYRYGIYNSQWSGR